MTSPPGSGSPDVPEAVEELVARARAEVEASEGEALLVVERHPRVAGALRVAAGVLREQSAERVGLAASGAAFWLFISAIPTAIAVVSVFGLVVSPHRVAADLGSLANAVPGSLGSLLTEQLERVAATNHAGLSFRLVVSVALAVSSASAGVNHLDGAIREAYGLPPERYLEARARALLGALAIVLLLGVGALVLPAAISRLPPLLTIPGVPLAVGVIVAGIAVLYRFSVAAPIPARALLPGAVASGVGVVLVTVGFGAYVHVSSRYTALYGAFSGGVIGMLAIYLAVYVVLLGAVLNTQLTGARATT